MEMTSPRGTRLWVSIVFLLFSSLSVVVHGLFPLPHNITSGDHVLYLHPRKFHFVSEGQDSEILSEAFERYERIYKEQSLPMYGHKDRIAMLSGAITKVSVWVTLNDQSLGPGTSEFYSLRVTAPTTVIQATTVYGAIRALETLAQLVEAVKVDENNHMLLPPDVATEIESIPYDDELENVATEEGYDDLERHGGRHKHHRKKKKHHDHDRKRTKTLLVVNETSLYDEPRFKHRGLLIDTSRHFLPLYVIKDHLDAMQMAKMNVLHWHISDDTSFPYRSDILPELSEKGAFVPDETIYTPEDVTEIVQYARNRGIRVVPEWDTPGHTESWGHAFPELLTDCYDARGDATGAVGPMDISRRGTYSLLWQLFKETAVVFPDAYLHIGGDEVDDTCWKSNHHIQEWIKDQGLRPDSRIQNYHTKRVIDLATAAGKTAVAWQEVYDEAGPGGIPNDVVIQVWKQNNTASGSSTSNNVLKYFSESRWGSLFAATTSNENGVIDWGEELRRVTTTHRAVLSSPWYLDKASSTKDWERMWLTNPIPFKAGIDQIERVLGGEACIWGELVDRTNSMTKTWPLAAAVAERLWSDGSVQDLEDARIRIEEHRCRMLVRGILAAPLGPGRCRADPIY